jgi:hypothetical protein
MQQTIPDLARSIGTSSGEAISEWSRHAAANVRRHRQEMAILAATLGFVVVVVLVSLPVVF